MSQTLTSPKLTKEQVTYALNKISAALKAADTCYDQQLQAEIYIQQIYDAGFQACFDAIFTKQLTQQLENKITV